MIFPLPFRRERICATMTSDSGSSFVVLPSKKTSVALESDPVRIRSPSLILSPGDASRHDSLPKSRVSTVPCTWARAAARVAVVPSQVWRSKLPKMITIKASTGFSAGCRMGASLGRGCFSGLLKIPAIHSA
jgi:hypothetical protein